MGGIVVLMLGVTAMCGLAGYFIMHKAKQAGLDSGLLSKNPGYAAAKMAATMNPELETVSTDDSSGTITVREKKTGKTTTLKFDAEKKTMVVTDENGKEATVKVNTDGDKGTHRSAVRRRQHEVRRIGKQSDARVDAGLSRLLADRNLLRADQGRQPEHLHVQNQ